MSVAWANQLLANSKTELADIIGMKLVFFQKPTSMIC